MSETTRKQSMAINNWTTSIFCISLQNYTLQANCLHERRTYYLTLRKIIFEFNRRLQDVIQRTASLFCSLYQMILGL
jgi:hypothetical protein